MSEVMAVFGEPEKPRTFACRRSSENRRLQISILAKCVPFRQTATILTNSEGASVLRIRAVGKGKTERRTKSMTHTYMYEVVDPAYNDLFMCLRWDVKTAIEHTICRSNTEAHLYPCNLQGLVLKFSRLTARPLVTEVELEQVMLLVEHKQ